ncbi:MAG TPA: FeoB small GTPase domain-containing protein [Fimbriimonadales bacterium]|jgi:ferrous iron transport protein B|nr:FeoB small GTPase domain-containing protein [Fimbriimonadales bacterium]
MSAIAHPIPNKTLLVAIVGNPNVGKSVLFNKLTGRYVTVSNYPGTTVEVSRGSAAAYSRKFTAVDTPGMYSLSPITEEERVSRQLLMQERPDLVVHVVDAKNLQRMLPLTLQLLEAGFEVVLMLNMMDEADKIGFRIDSIELQRRLGIPVIPAACLHGRGIDTLRDIIHDRIGA